MAEQGGARVIGFEKIYEICDLRVGELENPEKGER